MNSLKVLFDRDTWQEIFGSISKNKTRTVITVIGVLWGIFIYIALSGAAKGLDNGFERQFENIAMNSMFVWAQRTSIPYEGFKIGRSVELKLSDIEVLKKRVPEIEFIAPRNARGVLVVQVLLWSEITNQAITMFMETFQSILKLQLKKYTRAVALSMKKTLNINEKYV